jgi:pyridoxal phosphate enzyme (YggS family)
MIEENVRRILNELPEGVELVAAAKTRTPRELERAVEAGVRIVGENYVQEAAAARAALGDRVRWHFIGHLQKNKVKKAVEIFDMIETVDSVELAGEIDRRCRRLDKVLPVLIEINSGREPQKFGILPEKAEELARSLGDMTSIAVKGLMTMGPYAGDPEDARPYFSETRRVFESLRALELPGVEMRWLSMGMTNSYRVAVEEGANMVRLGTLLFGPR